MSLKQGRSKINVQNIMVFGNLTVYFEMENKGQWWAENVNSLSM